MTNICRELFKAIYENKWTYIEYKNKNSQITKYWIGINGINVQMKTLSVQGMHLGTNEVTNLFLYIDSILSATVLEGTLYTKSKPLAEDIHLYPEKYSAIFSNIPNLQVLNYLSNCNKLDGTPYKSEYKLIEHFDADKFTNGRYLLTAEQFAEITKAFQYRAYDSQKYGKRAAVSSLGLNVVSLNTKKGLYVLAYRKLFLNVENRVLQADDEIILCREFMIDGEKQSIRQFLEAEDFELLENFGQNAEKIKDLITQNNPHVMVDDMPYMVSISRDIPLPLEDEYAAIIDMYGSDTVSTPIKAFFGDLLKKPVRKKNYPITLLNQNINLDQLLAINNAMRYPLTYVQGPPGTGKTNTILNTILTAFFNEKTVLFTSYNNHPIDGVFEKLTAMGYKNSPIPFPIIRLGNNQKVAAALEYMKTLYNATKNITIYGQTLDKNKEEKIRRAAQLTELLSRYDEILDLNERKELVNKMLEENHQLTLQTELQTNQLAQINNRIKEIGKITDQDALKLVSNDYDEFRKYLFYTSAKYIKRISEPKNKDLLDIIFYKDKQSDPETVNERVNLFNKYLSDEENVQKFIKIFPIVLTTCIAAHKIGSPKSYFDMTVMDEASQCNTAVALVPIIRGENLMLVGDPQQLNPVILLDQKDNEVLRKKYSVSAEFDYISNSIYKTYLACDSVSDEILLSNHYRCHEKIIQFNNKKYYNGKLKVSSNVKSEKPLVLIDVKADDAAPVVRNTAPAEAEEVIKFIKNNPTKKIGVITPFVNQKALIDQVLEEENIKNVTCGTVHAFQGDEKDVILFSLGISGSSKQSSYDWIKNNKELLNVATSRAKEQLVMLCSRKNVKRLHSSAGTDDLYELIDYISSNGETAVTERTAMSRALGIKPYSTETESAFWENLNHAMGNIVPSNHRYVVRKEVPISQIFDSNLSRAGLFYTGRFDFVVYERSQGRVELPILAIELDGMEHYELDIVQRRDREKDKICRDHGFELVRVKNTYARRYQYIKDILESYFKNIG